MKNFVLLALLMTGTAWAGSPDEIEGFDGLAFGIRCNTEPSLVPIAAPSGSGIWAVSSGISAQARSFYARRTKAPVFMGVEVLNAGYGCRFDRLASVLLYPQGYDQTKALYLAFKGAFGAAQQGQDKSIRYWTGEHVAIIFTVQDRQSVAVVELRELHGGIHGKGGAKITIIEDWNPPLWPGTTGGSSGGMCSSGPYSWDPGATGGRRGGRCRDANGRYAPNSCCGR